MARANRKVTGGPPSVDQGLRIAYQAGIDSHDNEDDWYLAVGRYVESELADDLHPQRLDGFLRAWLDGREEERERRSAGGSE